MTHRFTRAVAASAWLVLIGTLFAVSAHAIDPAPITFPPLENFDELIGQKFGVLPREWSTATSGAGIAWATATGGKTSTDASGLYAYTGDPASIGESSLRTPAFFPPADAPLIFCSASTSTRQYYSCVGWIKRSRRDGAVVSTLMESIE